MIVQRSSQWRCDHVVSLLLTQFFLKARCMGLPAKSERVSVDTIETLFSNLCHLEVAQASHSDAYSERTPKWCSSNDSVESEHQSSRRTTHHANSHTRLPEQ